MHASGAAPSPAPARPVRSAAARFLRTAGWCGTLSAVLVVLVVLEWGPLMSADRELAHGLHRTAVEHPTWTYVSRLLTDWVWDPFTVRVLLALAALWLLRRGDRVAAFAVAASVAVGSVVQHGLKAAVGRERPVWPDPVDSAQFLAFPSGHAMTAALAAALLLWLATHRGLRGWPLQLGRLVALVSVLGVGFTRVYLGVHWLTDVLAGWLLGVATAAAGAAWCLRGRSCREGARRPG